MNTQKLVTTSLTLISLLYAVSAYSNPASEQEQAQVSLANKLIGNDLAQSNASMVNRFEITAGESKKTADIVFKPLSDNGNFSITLSAPLNDTSAPTDLFNTRTDAFANSTTLKLNHRWYYAPSIKLLPSQRDLYDICLASPKLFGFKEGDFKYIKEALSELSVSADTTVKQKVKDALDKKTKDFCKNKNEVLAANYKGDTSHAGYQKVKTVQDAYAKSSFSFFGTTASIGRQEYKYFESDSTSTTDETENPWGLSAYYSYVIPDTLWATIELAYQRGFEAQKSETRCPTAAETAAMFVSCANSSIGAPTNNTNRNLSLALRFKYMGMAFAPKFTFDFEDDENTFTLPVYFLGNDKGDLTAGVRFDRDTGGEGSQFSLFVGSKFEIYK